MLFAHLTSVQFEAIAFIYYINADEAKRHGKVHTQSETAFDF